MFVLSNKGDESLREAIAGLFSLAIIESKKKCRADNLAKLQSQDTDEAEKEERLQLCGHVYRGLNLDVSSQESIMRIVFSSDTEIHISSFVKLLMSEESDAHPDWITSSVALSKSIQDVIDGLEAMEAKSSMDASLEGEDPNVSKSAMPENILKAMASFKERNEPKEQYAYLKPEVEKLSDNGRLVILHMLVSVCVADIPPTSDGSQITLSPLVGYDARLRSALRLLASWFQVEWRKVVAMEYLTAYAAFQLQKEAADQASAAAAAVEEEKGGGWKYWKRSAMIGGTAAAAGALLAITGGLAAPAIAAGLAAVSPTLGAVPLFGTALASVATVASTVGSAAVISAFGAAGAGLGGFKMSRRVAGVEEFEFLELEDNPKDSAEKKAPGQSAAAAEEFTAGTEGNSAEADKKKWSWAKQKSDRDMESPTSMDESQARSGKESSASKGAGDEPSPRETKPQSLGAWRAKWLASRDVKIDVERKFRPRLAVTVCVSGFVRTLDDFSLPWGKPQTDSETYCLVYESKFLIPLSTALEDMLKTTLMQKAMTQGAMLTVLSSLVSAMAWPLALVGALDMIDSKWTMAVNRSAKAGKILADVLIDRVQGGRPVTLLGFSMGSLVIFSCLQRLAEKKAYGIVERVVMLGAPLPAKDDRWIKVRSAVSGRFVNGYNTNDWTLGLLYRSSFLISGVAGIQPVDVGGIKNADVTKFLERGHLSYLSSLSHILSALDIDGV